MKCTTSVHFYFFAVVLIAGGCAQQVGPGGGPKDVSPPVIVESSPLNFSTGFKGNRIVLRFDEFVQLKDLRSKLIISPPLKNLPDLKIKGKSLEISFDDTLYPNTTYNFQFGDGIVDNNEGNPLDSNLFVFSTGDKIDSLVIEGKVKNAFSLGPEKDVMVLLYDKFIDSLPYFSRPVYFARAGEDGNFKIQYLREGKFKVFALKDGNGNYLFDLPEEPIGFLDLPVSSGDSAKLEISIYQQELEKQFLKRAYAEHFGKIVFAFGKKTIKPKVITLNKTTLKDWYLEEFSENKDSLFYWLTDTQNVDTLSLQVWDNDILLDTAEIIMPKKENDRRRGRGEDIRETLVINARNASPAFDLFSPLHLQALQPVKTVDVSGIILSDSKDTMQFQINATDKAKRNFEILFFWNENTEYKLTVLPGAFEDFFAQKNDTVIFSFKTRKKADYGTIKLSPEFGKPAGNYIIQLMSENEKIIMERVSDGKSEMKFENLIAGQYKLKMIYDDNKNGVWDTGNYLKKIQPEKVIYYSSKIDLRPKFDLDISWKETN